MSSLLNSPAVQFLIVVIIVCMIAICSCVCIERLVAYLFPVTDLELGRVMYTAQAEVTASPAVTIHIDPATAEVDPAEEVQTLPEGDGSTPILQ